MPICSSREVVRGCEVPRAVGLGVMYHAQGPLYVFLLAPGAPAPTGL